jgi:hypothetical protein
MLNSGIETLRHRTKNMNQDQFEKIRSQVHAYRASLRDMVADPTLEENLNLNVELSEEDRNSLNTVVDQVLSSQRC